EETNARTTAIKGGANSSCWPQAVSLTTDTGAACGGVLIAPDKVLTAAHCFAPIVVGSLSVQVGFGPNGQGPNGGAPLTGSTVYLHPDYHQCLDYAQNGRSTHDLAVLQLPQAVNAFPPVSLTSSAPVVGSLAWAIGYGLPNYDRRRGAFQITSVGSDGVIVA